jgi:hypothetical protein
MAKPTWSKHHGKFWLEFRHNRTDYEIPVNPKNRHVDGHVLFSTGKQLVKNMGTFEAVLEQLLKSPDLLCVNRELGRFQAPIKMSLGLSLDFIQPEDAYVGDPPLA